MNSETGATYALGQDILDQAEKDRSGAPALLPSIDGIKDLLDRELSEEEKAAAVAQARGEAVVSVSETVVQKLRLGERELERRRRRQSRPTPPPPGPPDPPRPPRHRPVS